MTLYKIISETSLFPCWKPTCSSSFIRAAVTDPKTHHWPTAYTLKDFRKGSEKSMGVQHKLFSYWKETK
jgi:hypothetical protein